MAPDSRRRQSKFKFIVTLLSFSCSQAFHDVFSYVSLSSSSWSSSSSSSSRTSTTARTNIRSSSSWMSLLYPETQKTTTPPPSVCILSFDGAVAETSVRRCQWSVEAALDTWPHLRSYDSLGDGGNGNRSWLLNKMKALLPCVSLSGCDSVLLARLLLEEQELDDGRSTGTEGKYASKYHPSGNGTSDNKQQRRRGSRPLTVGEIYENWSMIVNTLYARYDVDVATLQRNLAARILREDDPTPLKISPKVSSFLRTFTFQIKSLAGDTSTKLYVLVDHPSLVPIAKASMASVGVDPTMVTIVAPNDATEAPADVVERLLRSHTLPEEQQRFVVVHGSLPALREAKPRLLGEDSPRFVDGVSESTVQWQGYDVDDHEDDDNHGNDNDTRVILALPSWADTTNDRQHDDVLMDSWLNLFSLDQLVDLLSSTVESVWE